MLIVSITTLKLSCQLYWPSNYGPGALENYNT